MHIEKMPYDGWQGCGRISNSLVDLIITGEVGPRILRFGLLGERNQFHEYENDRGNLGGDAWRMYGGHRLWHAPEGIPRSYYPDNQPVSFEEHEDFIRVVQRVETTTGIQKEMDIHLKPGAAQVTIIHRLRNTNLWPIELAPWALTLMAHGGTAILPLPPRGSHDENLLPTNTLSIWSYTDLSDPRWNFGKTLILLRQDPQAQSPQKIGMQNKDGWLAYARGGDLFIKCFDYLPERKYPDLGCSAEVFTRWDIMEIETLGPLSLLQPGGEVEHTESWHLISGTPEATDPEQVEREIIPLIKEIV